MLKNPRQILKYSVFTLLGAVFGILYYKFIGCNGACLIGSNPWISTGYGALLGALLAGSFSSKKKNNKNPDKSVTDAVNQ